MANLALNQNQTFQTPVLGMVTMDPQPNTVSALIDPASTAAFICVGQSVKLIAGAGSQILVDVCSAVTDVVFGVIAYNMRKNIYVKGDIVSVVGRGGIMMMETSAAVARGTGVAILNPTVATNDPTISTNTTASNAIVGYALGSAAGAGELIKVQVAPGINSAAGAGAVAGVFGTS